MVGPDFYPNTQEPEEGRTILTLCLKRNGSSAKDGLKEGHV